MAPKPVEKKSAQKKAPSYVPRELDASRYIRKPENLDPVSEVNPLVPPLIGLLANVDNLFPEWSMDNQSWHDIPDGEENVKYPTELKAASLQSLRALLNLEFISDSKTKKDYGKKIKENFTEMSTELLKDDDGRILPRVTFADDDNLNVYYLPFQFRRTFSREQFERKAFQDNLKARVVTANAGTSQEMKSKKSDLQLHYDTSISLRDVYTEQPLGCEIDPSMCAAFRIVSEFAQKHDYSCNKPTNRLLWNLIYPQLTNGRPVYNTSGKYAVKLFLGGKWRKVLITDIVPVNSGGAALASSSESLELWPLILAKAVYSVYTACGYNYTLPSLSETNGENNGSNFSSCCYKTSSFVSFAVHVLTGWQPSTPRCLKSTFDCDIQRSRGLLQEILFGGVSVINETDIPSLLPPVLTMGGGPSGGDIVQSDLLKYQTKKQFKEEYSIRFAERLKVIEMTKDRDNKAVRLDNTLLQTISEGFFLCLQNSITDSKDIPSYPNTSNSVRSVPILGICLPESTNNNDSTYVMDKTDNSITDLLHFIHSDSEEERDFKLLNDIKFLIKWRTTPPCNSDITTESKSPLPSTEILPIEISRLLHGINDPLPNSIKIESEWISIKDIIHNNSFIIGFDTNTRLPHKSVFNWNWTPLVDEKNSEKAVKALKGRTSGEQFRSAYVVCGDAGCAPPLLLSVSTKDFFRDLESAECADPGSVEKREKDVDKEKEIANLSLSTSSSSAFKVPKSAYLSISLSVHADLIIPTGDDVEVPASPRILTSRKSTIRSSRDLTSQAANLIPSMESKVDLSASLRGTARLDRSNSLLIERTRTENVDVFTSSSMRSLPSDVVVILQEIRSDEREPLVMRIEMSPNANIPITRTSFHIPSDRVQSNKDNLIFWVRIFTKSSIHLSVCCAVPVVIGEVEDIWSDAGGSILVRDGKASVTRSNTEQLLFRIPLQISSSDSKRINSGLDSSSHDMTTPNNNCSDQKFQESMGSRSISRSHDDNREVLNESNDLFGDLNNNSNDIKPDLLVTSFLHIADRDVARSVSMVLLSDCDRDIPISTYSMPRIDCNNFYLSGSTSTSTSTSSCKTLIGRCYPSIHAQSTCNEKDGPKAALPGFKWKLYVMSLSPLANPPVLLHPPSQSIVRSLQQRYKGFYKPNNRLILFRDVYAYDQISFPIGLRIAMLPFPGLVSSSSASLLSSTPSSSENLAGLPVSQFESKRKKDEINTSQDILENVHFIVRLYRKYDRVLISESKGCSVLQLYNIRLDGILTPPDINLGIASPGSAPDTPTAKGKKVVVPKKVVTHKDSNSVSNPGKVEFILECQLDDTVMKIPNEWQSRLPFAFSTNVPNTPIMAISNSFKTKKGDTFEDKRPTTPLSSVFPPALPQFIWQVDILAGTVLEVNHDVYDLEKRLEMKNTWEETNMGRAEKAIAAMSYATEKKLYRTGILQSDSSENLFNNSPSGEINGIDIGTSDLNQPVTVERLVDLLSTALDKDENKMILSEREIRLLGLKECKVHIIERDPTSSTVPLARIEHSALQALKVQNLQCKETSEKASKQIGSMVLQLNEMMRADAADRVLTLSSQANATAARISVLWNAREQYRLSSIQTILAHKVLLDNQAAKLLLSNADDSTPQTDVKKGHKLSKRTSL